MRRVSLVSVVAAAVVLGHLAYHMAPRLAHAPGLTGAPLPPATVPAPLAAHLTSPPLIAPTCRLQPPLAEADRQPMLDVLPPLVARDDPDSSWQDRDFLRRFETCGVDMRERPDYVLVATPFGGMWLDARFRKTADGWIALPLTTADIQ